MPLQLESTTWSRVAARGNPYLQNKTLPSVGGAKPDKAKLTDTARTNAGSETTYQKNLCDCVPKSERLLPSTAEEENNRSTMTHRSRATPSRARRLTVHVVCGGRQERLKKDVSVVLDHVTEALAQLIYREKDGSDDSSQA